MLPQTLSWQNLVSCQVYVQHLPFTRNSDSHSYSYVQIFCLSVPSSLCYHPGQHLDKDDLIYQCCAVTGSTVGTMLVYLLAVQHLRTSYKPNITRIVSFIRWLVSPQEYWLSSLSSTHWLTSMEHTGISYLCNFWPSIRTDWLQKLSVGDRQWDHTCFIF